MATVETLCRWRCEFKNSNDKNLIAKFFYAVDAQGAMQAALKWHGSACQVIVTLD